MTSTVMDAPPRPDASGPGSRHGGGPARRAVIRWAIRLFRREWRQQVLVIVLLTVAVTGAVFGVCATYNLASSSDATYGSANHLMWAAIPAVPARSRSPTGSPTCCRSASGRP